MQGRSIGAVPNMSTPVFARRGRLHATVPIQVGRGGGGLEFAPGMASWPDRHGTRRPLSSPECRRRGSGALRPHMWRGGVSRAHFCSLPEGVAGGDGQIISPCPKHICERSELDLPRSGYGSRPSVQYCEDIHRVGVLSICVKKSVKWLKSGCRLRIQPVFSRRPVSDTPIKGF
jgi:hypothetical protein